MAFAVVSRLCLMPLQHKCSLSACGRCQSMRGLLLRKLCTDSHKAGLLAEGQDALQERGGGSTAIPSEVLWHPLKGEAHQVEH